MNDYEFIYLVNENKEYLNMFIHKYKPLITKKVNYYLNKYKTLTLDFDELEQECFIALFRAVKTFEEKRGALPYTYINICLKGALEKYIRNFTSLKRKALNESLSFYIEKKEDLFLGDTLSIKEDEIEYKLKIIDLERKLYSLKYEFNPLKSAIYELMINHFTIQEIAELLDLKEKKVDNELYSIRKILKENYSFLLKN